MKQIINQNIQFIEYNGRPETIVFDAVYSNSEWADIKVKSIQDKYALLIIPIQTNIDTYKDALKKELANPNPNQSVISQLQTLISDDSKKITDLNIQMQNEIKQARDEYPYGDIIIQENSVVWVNHSLYNGAYIVQKKKWVKLPTVSNLYSKKGKKLYSTDSSNPAYMMNDLTNPSDTFNQISKLINGGYILLSQNDEPYLLYEYQNLDNFMMNPHVVFNVPKCMEDNGIHNTNPADNINKVLTFNELLGVCDNFEQASVVLSFDTYNIKADTTYTVRVDSTNSNIAISDSEFILDNIDNKQKTFSTNIRFLDFITNSVFHIYVSLYSNEILIDKDVISIYVNCPKKPDPTPLPAKIKTSITIL